MIAWLLVGALIGAFVTYRIMFFRAENARLLCEWQEDVDRRRAKRQQLVLEHAWRAGFIRVPGESTEGFIKRFVESNDLADLIDVDERVRV